MRNWNKLRIQKSRPSCLLFLFFFSFFLSFLPSRAFQRRSGWFLRFYERSGKKRSRGKTRSLDRRYDSVSSYETERNKSRRFARTLRDYTYARRSCRSGVFALFFQPGLFCFAYRSRRVLNDRGDIREINPGCCSLFYYECIGAIFEASGVGSLVSHFACSVNNLPWKLRRLSETMFPLESRRRNISAFKVGR